MHTPTPTGSCQARGNGHATSFSRGRFALTLIAIVLALKSFGINQECQRGVVFRLGRLMATKGPGWF